jgi:acetyltransferase-like isoleucine patch superfamily enzyme
MAISETASIAPQARLGRGVSVGEFTVIRADVELGDDCTVDSHCLLGCETPLAAGPLVIGAGSRIRSHSTFYRGSSFGPAMTTGHHVTVREGTRAGARLQLGTMADIQGDTTIGEDVRTQSSVFVPKHTTIGNYVWLFPFVVLTNDRQPPSPDPLLGPTIGDYAVIGAHTTVLAGVRIGEHAVVGAHSFVRTDVEDHALVAGSPARRLGDAREVRDASDPGSFAYPWTRRFHRGYPRDVVSDWMASQELGPQSEGSDVGG